LKTLLLRIENKKKKNIPETWEWVVVFSNATLPGILVRTQLGMSMDIHGRG
jgi:negative regulator of replication initiation